VVEDILSKIGHKNYRFPDPKDSTRYTGLPAFIAANADRFRYLSIAYSLYERAWSLRGMEIRSVFSC
jgi:uroporphyrinogen decarboxylase